MAPRRHNLRRHWCKQCANDPAAHDIRRVSKRGTQPYIHLPTRLRPSFPVATTCSSLCTGHFCAQTPLTARHQTDIMTVQNVEAAKRRYSSEMADFTLRKWNKVRQQQEQVAAKRQLDAPTYAFAGDLEEDRGRTLTKKRAPPILKMPGRNGV
ncbi:hypothetical protein PENSPDRAFT_19031 [Peniophora sp. CONT]|nr:hypothetical protein PENSPDRAFT_19031 [Peniophora sp. CONT]